MNQNNYDDLIMRLSNILKSRQFKLRLNTVNSNWLEMPTEKVVDGVLKYFESLKEFEVYS